MLGRWRSYHLVLDMCCLILNNHPDPVSKLTTVVYEILLQEVHLVLLQFEYLVISVLLRSLYHLLNIILIFGHLLHHLFLC